MAAARKWSDAQRAAMYALWEQGYGSAEIARRMGAGSASCAPVEIPKRSVHSICSAIDAERAGATPRSLEDAAKAAAEGSSLEAVRRLLDDEYARYQAKQRQRPLTLIDLERVEKIAAVRADLDMKLRRRELSTSRGSQRNGAQGAHGEDGGALERLVKQERQEAQRPASTDTEADYGSAAGHDTNGATNGEVEDAKSASTHAHARPEPPDLGEEEVSDEVRARARELLNGAGTR